MQTRTWPYGTKKSVTVLERGHMANVSVLIVQEDGTDEAFVMMDGGEKYIGVAPDDRGTITFTKGGPTGGYWEYTPATLPFTTET